MAYLPEITETTLHYRHCGGHTMSTPANLRFLGCSIFGESNSLVKVLDLLQSMGVIPALLEVGSLAYEQFAFWREYNEQTRLELGVAQDKRQLTFRTADEHSHMTLTFTIEWSIDDAGKLAYSLLQATAFQTAIFTRKEHDPEYHAKRFWEIGARLYTLIQPSFGWIERCRPSGYTTWQDLRDLLIPHIYWANFFGSAYVSKYSKDFLMNAPGWKNEELSDNGVLYVLTPSLVSTGSKPVVEEVRRYFKVESVRGKR
jgi:hypothetical protein